MSPWTRDPGSAPPTVDDPVRPGDVWSNQDTAQIPAAPPLQPPHQPPPPPPLPPLAAHPTPPPPSPGGKRALRAIAATAVAVGLVGGGAAIGRMIDDEPRADAVASQPTTVGSTIPRAERPNTTSTAPSSAGGATSGNVAPPSLDPTLEPIVAAAKAAKPGVVQIETQTGLGSGFIFTDDGYVLTAAHVVAGSSTVAIRLGDGSGYQGTVVGVDEQTDVAVVKITDPPDDLPVASLALEDAPEVGQQVIAIGSPFGLDQTVTAGIVSTVSRPVPVPDSSGRVNVVGMIQTDAPINSGNSGGALVNLDGQVIGINDQIRTTTGDNAGIGFAIPIDLAYQVAQLLIRGEDVRFGYLGVTTDEPSFGQAGALVTQVVDGSPAAQAGLQEGDVVTAVDGQAVRSYEELISGIRSRLPGDQLSLTVTRGDEQLTFDVTLGTAAGR